MLVLTRSSTGEGHTGTQEGWCWQAAADGVELPPLSQDSLLVYVMFNYGHLSAFDRS